MGQRAAVITVFALNGVALGNWAPRTPALSDRVGAEPGTLGLALLGGSVGMILSATVSGRLVERFGTRVVVAASTLGTFLVLPLLGVAPSLAWLAVVLLVLGAVSAALDVSMNVAGVAVERDEGRPVMPLFHAGFSLGALVGAGAAALAGTHGWSPARQFAVAAVAGIAVLGAVVRAVPGNVPLARSARAPSHARGPAPARRPVLWLLAAIALCSAIAEGAGSDWSALLLTTEQGAGEGAAAMAYAGFSLAMAATRFAGSWLQARLGAVRVLVAGSASAATGLAVSSLAGVPAVSYAGFALAGAGLAACFPVALGLAGEAGERPDGSGGEREVAFVTAIAYTGFLTGPPLIGGIAHLTSLSVSFVVVAVIAATIVPATVAAGRRVRRERTSGTSRGAIQ